MDRIARGLPETAVDFPMIKPKPFEQTLNLRLLRPAQENLAFWPNATQAGFAVDPLRKQAKGKSVGIRIIIRLQNPVICRQKESRTGGAGGKEQGCLRRRRKRVPVGALDALRGKGGEAAMQRGKAEIFGQDRFGSPGEARLPTGLAQKIRNRSQAIEDIVPNIGRASSRVTDRIFEKSGRKKLRPAHRAGPGAFHRRAGNAAPDRA